jgi:hypothetical protein
MIVLASYASYLIIEIQKFKAESWILTNFSWIIDK